MKNKNLALETDHRKLLTKASRVVVKIGTNVLVNKNGKPNRRRIAMIAQELIALKKKNYEIILVSSGAIGAGLQVLGMKKRPTALCDLQMAAAVGQMQLMNHYNDCFTKSNYYISQVLLTHTDLKNRTRHLNARNTILNLLHHNIIPIINENDVIANDEIKIGDNDVLSAMVATLIDADALILLTTPDGLRKSINKKQTQRVSYLESVSKATLKLVFGKESELSTGGMESKLQAAQTAAKAGSLVVIASGFKRNVIQDITLGKDIGTLIGNKYAELRLSKRKQWISYFHQPQGTIIVNVRASEALKKRGASLLAVGIENIKNDFPIGAMVDIVDQSGKPVGHGLSEYSSDEIKSIKGKHSSQIISILGYKNSNAVVHRDNLVILD